VTYEGYGAGGIAVLVECLTDNRNRTVAELRHVFSKRGGSLGTDGSVAYLFRRTGQLSYIQGDEDQIMEAALEAGAEDVVIHEDGSIDVITAFEDFLTVKDAMIAAGLIPDRAEVIMLPSTTVELDKVGAEQIMNLVDMLEDLDDVQNVYTNADIPDQILEQFA
jgi:YebC/PmpR family DNA-binding regulatory protein